MIRFAPLIRGLVRVLLLTLAFYIATRLAGWWAVPLTAVVWGWLSDGDGRSAAIAACLAWAALLVRDAIFGPFSELADTLGALFHAPAALVVALTLVFPMLLAWSAAVVSGAVRRSRSTSPPRAR